MNRDESKGIVILDALEDEISIRKANGIEYSGIKVIRDYIENKRECSREQAQKFKNIVATLRSIKELPGLDKGKNKTLNAFYTLKNDIEALCTKNKRFVPTEDILKTMKMFQREIMNADK